MTVIEYIMQDQNCTEETARYYFENSLWGAMYRVNKAVRDLFIEFVGAFGLTVEDDDYWHGDR